MGMNSPELLLLVENCPKGAETLVTRCLHSLTDKGVCGSLFCPRRMMVYSHVNQVIGNWYPLTRMAP